MLNKETCGDAANVASGPKECFIVGLHITQNLVLAIVWSGMLSTLPTILYT